MFPTSRIPVQSPKRHWRMGGRRLRHPSAPGLSQICRWLCVLVGRTATGRFGSPVRMQRLPVFRVFRRWPPCHPFHLARGISTRSTPTTASAGWTCSNGGWQNTGASASGTSNSTSSRSSSSTATATTASTEGSWRRWPRSWTSTRGGRPDPGPSIADNTHPVLIRIFLKRFIFH